jgi:glycosyltransferase involved in cell wall biosynthesis
MKVLLLGTHPKGGISSMKLFAETLCAGLRERGHDVRLLQPIQRMRVLVNSSQELEKWIAYLDKFVFFPREFRGQARWADIIHLCDHSDAPYINYLDPERSLVTCHDVIGIQAARGYFPETHVRWTGRVLQSWTALSLKRCKHIVCVSETTKRELAGTLGIDRNNVDVVYNGLNYHYKPMRGWEADRRLKGLGNTSCAPFFLHVGGNSWRKNRLGAIRIFAELLRVAPTLGSHLILVGPQLTESEKALLAARGLRERVRTLTRIDGADLCALYSRASLLLFPSLYEGFGWPIIEAQACGCLVVTSNRDPMKEISGGGAVLVDPRDATKAALVISEALGSIAESITTIGYMNAKKFTAHAMIDNYEKVYTEVIN